MDHEAYLKDRQQELVKKWFCAVIDTYPADSATFFKADKDPFANPVGNTLNRSLNLVYAEVIKKKMDPEAARQALEPIARIRAVQDFSASEALAFVFDIKHLIRKALAKTQQDKRTNQYLGAIEANTDKLILIAFDLYMKCRQKIYLLRVNQAKEGVKKLLIKKGLISEIPDIGCELRDA